MQFISSALTFYAVLVPILQLNAAHPSVIVLTILCVVGWIAAMADVRRPAPRKDREHELFRERE